MALVNLLLQLINDMERDIGQVISEDILKSHVMNEVLVMWRGSG